MPRRGLLFLSLGLALSWCLPGCGGAAPVSDAGGASEGGQAAAAGDNQTAKVPIGAQPVVRVVNGKKWIGDVPQDIYFEDPL